MKNLFLIPLFFIQPALPISAQPSIEWQKALGGTNTDQAYSIQQTADAGYIVTGRTLSDDGDVSGNYGGVDFWVVKLYSSGAIQWEQTYGGSNHDRPRQIQQTIDKGFVIVGSTLSNDENVSGNHGDYDAWVLKLDSIGVIEWQKCLGGSGWEEAWAVQQTTDGGYILAGRSGSTDGDVTINQGSLDYWVVKLTVTGEIEWQKSLGGSGLDIAYAVKQASDGGYIVTGESSSINGDVTLNHGNSDYWVVKLNYEGKVEWEKSLGGTSVEESFDVFASRDGGFIVFGQSYSNNGDVNGNHGGYDLWVVKLSEYGEIEWQKALGGSNDENAATIIQTNDGGFVMTGTTQSVNGDVVNNDGGADIWVIKLSEEGDTQWQKTLGGTKAEFGHSIQQTREGGFIVAGYARSNDGDVSGVHGGDDFWIVKLSSESSPTTEAHSLRLGIFPNPAISSISFEIPDLPAEVSTKADVITICISDLLGRELSRQIIPLNQSVNIATLPNGLYLLTATTHAGKVYAGKFRKQE